MLSPGGGARGGDMNNLACPTGRILMSQDHPGVWTGPPREYVGPGANLPWGPHDIFKLDPTRP